MLNQIKADAYRYQKNIPKQHNFPKALPEHLAEQADESLKSVYNLDFLDITKPVLERELERRLTEKVKRFMLELGKGFSFIGNQYRLVLKDNEYFVDMLFYNRILKSLVAVELLCGAPHKSSYVASPVMWRSPLEQESFRRGAQKRGHINNSIIGSLDTPSDLHCFADALRAWSQLRKEPKPLLSFQDQFQHKCLSC